MVNGGGVLARRIAAPAGPVTIGARARRAPTARRRQLLYRAAKRHYAPNENLNERNPAAVARFGRRKHEPIARRLGRLLRSLALLLAAGGIVTLGMEAIGWFRVGIWSTTSLLDLWLALGNSYSLRAASGTDRWLLQLLDLPLGVTLLALALLLLVVARSLLGAAK